MKSILLSAGGMTVSLGRYEAGRKDAPHRDPRSRISIMLRGSCREDGPSGQMRMVAGDVLFKSSDVLHEDAFGEHGAALLAVELEPNDQLLSRIGSMCWRRRTDSAALRLSTALIEAAARRDATAIDAAAADLIAGDDGDRAASAPAWLLRLRQQLAETNLAAINVGARAREAGVHPAHASRAFRRCFGVSITEHAQAHSVRRALALMARPQMTLSEAAAGAGFYDQSHMNRVFKRMAGASPGRHRQLVDRILAMAG